jgi:predicted GNAT superfamily acetyltransferase
MLGVLTDYNDLGIGRLLKLHQREEALARGIRLIEWTFDPLELKNAYFNMERLGAIVRRYVENQYGMTSSPLHGGLPTDRLVAEWWLGSERAARVLDGAGYKRPEIVDRIEVPGDIASIRRKNAKAAREVQRSIGDRFQRHFQQGFAVIGFERTPDSGVYLIGRPEEKE